jgi:hypothetical protein
MQITLDRRTLSEWCSDRGTSFVVVRGSAYDSGRPFGLYLVALHGHSPDGRLAHIAVAIPDRDQPRRIAAAILVTERSEQFDCQFVSWSDSPWRGEEYLGDMLEPENARGSAHRELFFAVVGRVIEDLPEVRGYFS